MIDRTLPLPLALRRHDRARNLAPEFRVTYMEWASIAGIVVAVVLLLLMSAW